MTEFIRLPENPDDTEEEQAVPEAEYDLEIIAVGEAYVKEEGGRTILPVTIKVADPDFPSAKLVGHWLVFPTDADREEEPATFAMMMRGIKRFNAVFGLDGGDTLDPDTLMNATGRCYLKQEEYEGEINNKLRLPRVR